jgi:DNA-binding FadR family transcriptional regulator
VVVVRSSQPKRLEDTLLAKIAAGAYKDGDRLPSETELARAYGLSRASVREALKRLHRIGVIRTVQGASGGSFVQRLDLSVVTDALSLLLQMNGITLDALMEARRALAPSVAALAAERATEADVARLQDLCDTVADGLREGRFEADAIVRFHIELAGLTRNPFLEAVATPLAEVTGVFFRRLWRIELGPKLPRLLALHQALLDPLRRHDPDAARAAMVVLMREIG